MADELENLINNPGIRKGSSESHAHACTTLSVVCAVNCRAVLCMFRYWYSHAHTCTALFIVCAVNYHAVVCMFRYWHSRAHTCTVLPIVWAVNCRAVVCVFRYWYSLVKLCCFWTGLSLPTFCWSVFYNQFGDLYVILAFYGAGVSSWGGIRGPCSRDGWCPQDKWTECQKKFPFKVYVYPTLTASEPESNTTCK